MDIQEQIAKELWNVDHGFPDDARDMLALLARAVAAGIKFARIIK